MSAPVSGRIAAALNAASQARLVLAGKARGDGFWAMPHGAHFVRTCWQQNMERARRLLNQEKSECSAQSQNVPALGKELPKSGNKVPNRNGRGTRP